MMERPTYAQLYAAATSLLTKAGLSAAFNDTRAGLWGDIARSVEQLAGTTSTANSTIDGYMTRAAVALEGKFGGSGAEESGNRAGLLKRIVDAFELNAGVGTGSYGNRLAAGAAGAEFVDRGVRITAQNAVTVTGTSDGYRITKTGAAGQDGAAVSGLLAGDFLLRLSHTAGSFGAALGFGASPTSGNDFTDLPFAVAWSDQTTLYTYVNGVFTGTTVTKPDGIFLIRRVGDTITVEGTGTYIFVAKNSANLGFRSSLYFTNEAIDVRLVGS